MLWLSTTSAARTQGSAWLGESRPCGLDPCQAVGVNCRRMSSPGTAAGERHARTVIEVDHALVVRLRPEAARRDVPVVRLIHDLLDVIVRDGLTGAVLDADAVRDDGEPSAQEAPRCTQRAAPPCYNRPMRRRAASRRPGPSAHATKKPCKSVKGFGPSAVARSSLTGMVSPRVAPPPGWRRNRAAGHANFLVRALRAGRAAGH